MAAQALPGGSVQLAPRCPQLAYALTVTFLLSSLQETMDLVREKGLFSFYEDGHGECCRVRKVGGVETSWGPRAGRAWSAQGWAGLGRAGAGPS